MEPKLIDFFASFRQGNVTGYAHFHTDPNFMHKDTHPDKDGLVKVQYNILSLKGKTDKMAVGDTFVADYNPLSGFIIPFDHMVFEFDRVYEEYPLAECRFFTSELEAQLQNVYKYVHLFIPDKRKNYPPVRLTAKVIGRSDNELRVTIISQLDIPVFGIECLIDRSLDNCRVETVLREREQREAKALDIDSTCVASVMSVDDLSAYMTIKRRAAK